jgi:hypothetical protein
MAYNRDVELIETSIFTRQIRVLLSDEEYRRFQLDLAANPSSGALIKGGRGIRKVRIALPARGKSGGARVIYYWAAKRHVILLLLAYRKADTSDLTPGQISVLAKEVEQEFGR